MLRRTIARSSPGLRIAIAGVVVLVAAGTWGMNALRTHAARTPQSLRLSDGTTVFFLSGTRVEPATGYPRPREIHVDGDAFVSTPAGSQPLVVRTRLMILTVTAESALRVTAYSREPGEQVEVLRGSVEVRKSYRSPYDQPDVLAGGEMSMVNRTIDLMEKETFDTAELRQQAAAVFHAPDGA
jgi:ferric-dicitrate binding protein FerR (iron transport regulator)